MRLDAYLVQKGMTSSRERAKELIQKGQVSVNGKTVTKPAFDTEDTDSVLLTGETLRYVSRGGLKLEKAIAEFSPVIEGKVCLDIGASTGGFTDCMLQNGAQKVYAVDVGTGQLHEKLLNDTRVVNREKTNIRTVTKDDFPEEIGFVSIDVSFISLTLVLPVVGEILSSGGTCVALIKPQFEAGKGNVGKKGVVKDRKVREAVVKNITAFAENTGFQVKGVCTSPILGPEGNEEYLICLKK